MRRPMRFSAWLALLSLVAGCMARGPLPTTSPQVPPGPLPPAGDGSKPAPAVPVFPAAPAVPLSLPARLQPAAGQGVVASQCLSQIEGFAELHSGSRVILGQAAFAESDELVLARMQRRGVDGRLLDGRAAPPKPVVLKLLTGPDGCLLRLADTGSAQVSLPACNCTVLTR